jgi:hypothetical protein
VAGRTGVVTEAGVTGSGATNGTGEGWGATAKGSWKVDDDWGVSFPVLTDRLSNKPRTSFDAPAWWVAEFWLKGSVGETEDVAGAGAAAGEDSPSKSSA